MQALLIPVIFISAAAMFISGRLVRHFGLPEVNGASIALVVIGIAFLIMPSTSREWLGDANDGEQMVAFIREMGITGLLFLAGTRLRVNESLKSVRASIFVAVSGLAFTAFVAVLLALSTNQSGYASVAMAAAIAAGSLWLPSELSVGSKHLNAAAASKGAAVMITGALMLAAHFYSVFYEMAGRHLSSNAYGIVGLYEVVKVVMFFSLACFVASRFLVRAGGKVSTSRVVIGYLLIAVLVFVLANMIMGELAAFAWAFTAGALFNRNEVVRRFSETDTPIASALLLSLVFLPMLLATHGRAIVNSPALLLAIVAALTAKFISNLIAAKLSGISTEDAKIIAASSLSPAETAIIFLGFAMTHWSIEGAEYFGIIGFAIISVMVGSTFQWTVMPTDSGSSLQCAKLGVKQASSKKIIFAVIFIGAALALASPAQAQSLADDPVTHAMKSIDAAVNSRAQAAETVINASKLVSESTEARKQGEQKRAAEALKEAQKIATGSSVPHTVLMEDLVRSIETEQDALSPKKSPVTTDTPFTIAVSNSRSVRMSQYRETLGRILEEERVPIGLLGVAFVESGFNPLAHSPKGARGIWQFIPTTAQRYGLTVEPGNDHRTHPEHSTRAAAKYLRYLYEMFGDWKLALAAYNAGENRLLRIIGKTGIRSFEEMSRRRLLPAETRNYVPLVLAAWPQFSRQGAAAKPVIRAEKTDRQPARSGFVIDALTRVGGAAQPSGRLRQR